MKLIIAEDNKIEQRTICDMIKKSGLDIEICAVFSNGRDALDYLSDSNIDLIISDIQMPHFSGIELLKTINEKKIKTKVIFVSCYDNPEYLMNAIQNNAASYILKPIKKQTFINTLTKVYEDVNATKVMEEQLEKAEELKKYAREKQLRELIFMNETSTESLLPEFKNIKNVAIAVVGIEDYNPYCDFLLNNSHEMMLITNYISELNYTDIEFHTVIINAQSVAIPIFFHSSPIDTTEIFDDFSNYVLTNFGICVKIGISNTSNNIMQLSQLYREAVDALAYSDLTQKSAVLNYNNINFKTEYPYKLIEIVTEIRKLLQAPSEEKVVELIDRYLDLPNLSGSYIQKFAYSFVHSIELNINEYGKSLEDLMGNEIWTKLSTYNSESNTKKLLYNIFFAAYELLNDNLTDGNDVVKAVKDIIHENFSDKITTEYLSKKINYSQRYISLIFKKETGQTILQYLTEFRIEKAKEFLRSKDSKVYQVANIVGYTRNSHFNNIFKKYVGMSPYDYKEKYTE